MCVCVCVCLDAASGSELELGTCQTFRGVVDTSADVKKNSDSIGERVRTKAIIKFKSCQVLSERIPRFSIRAKVGFSSLGKGFKGTEVW